MRRWVLACVFGFGCRHEAVATAPASVFGEQASDVAAAPPPTPAADDYAVARRSFHTKLVRKGPAPETHPPLSVPADAREIDFDSGGLALKAWISRAPSPSARAPAVLFLHPGFSFDAAFWRMMKGFRDAGFVVMEPRLRGENGLPGAFTLFYDEVDDALAATDVLAKQPGVDASRVYVLGYSAGGVVGMLAAMTSKRFRALASLSGPPEVKTLLGQSEWVPFDPSVDAELRMRSPLAFATSFKCPARLYVGDQEALFLDSTRETARLAKAAGLDVEAEVVPGDHMSMPVAALPRALVYFQQH